MKAKPKAPTPVDPNVITQGQETAGINTAIAQQALNQTGQSGPFGSTSYNQTGTTTVDGHAVPTYTQNSSLSPLLQSLLNSGLGGANTAAANQGTALSGFGSLQNPNLVNQSTVDALYGQAKSRLDPQWETNQRRFDQSLADKGIPLGSAAYDRAAQNFNLGRNDAYTSAQNSATEAGVRDASQLYADTLAGRQQATNESNQPLSNLNLIMSLIRGTSPGAPGASPNVNVQTPDILGAYGLQAQQQQNAYNQQLASYNSGLGGLGSLLGSLGSAAILA